MNNIFWLIIDLICMIIWAVELYKSLINSSGFLFFISLIFLSLFLGFFLEKAIKLSRGEK